jgi:hypothetical protein
VRRLHLLGRDPGVLRSARHRAGRSRNHRDVYGDRTVPWRRRPFVHEHRKLLERRGVLLHIRCARRLCFRHVPGDVRRGRVPALQRRCRVPCGRRLHRIAARRKLLPALSGRRDKGCVGRVRLGRGHDGRDGERFVVIERRLVEQRVGCAGLGSSRGRRNGRWVVVGRLVVVEWRFIGRDLVVERRLLVWRGGRGCRRVLFLHATNVRQWGLRPALGRLLLQRHGHFRRDDRRHLELLPEDHRLLGRVVRHFRVLASVRLSVRSGLLRRREWLDGDNVVPDGRAGRLVPGRSDGGAALCHELRMRQRRGVHPPGMRRGRQSHSLRRPEPVAVRLRPARRRHGLSGRASAGPMLARTSTS